MSATAFPSCLYLLILLHLLFTFLFLISPFSSLSFLSLLFKDHSFPLTAEQSEFCNRRSWYCIGQFCSLYSWIQQQVWSICAYAEYQYVIKEHKKNVLRLHRLHYLWLPFLGRHSLLVFLKYFYLSFRVFLKKIKMEINLPKLIPWIHSGTEISHEKD